MKKYQSLYVFIQIKKIRICEKKNPDRISVQLDSAEFIGCLKHLKLKLKILCCSRFVYGQRLEKAFLSFGYEFCRKKSLPECFLSGRTQTRHLKPRKLD